MPCGDGGYSSSDFDRMQTRLDKATRAACEMEKLLTGKQRKKLSEATEEWIARHQAEDERRQRNEAVAYKIQQEKHKALNKLTSRERALLGIPRGA